MKKPSLSDLLKRFRQIRLAPRRLMAALLGAIMLLTGSFWMLNFPDGLKQDLPESQRAPAVPAPTANAPDAVPERPSEGGEIPDTDTSESDRVIAHSLPKEAAVPEPHYTAHFARSELMCDCTDSCNGFPVEMDGAFMEKLEALRMALGRPVIITSGVRCAARNDEVGGIPDSWHLTGHAADLYCPGVPCEEVAQAARQLQMGVILYPQEAYCHVEYREG